MTDNLYTTDWPIPYAFHRLLYRNGTCRVSKFDYAVGIRNVQYLSNTKKINITFVSCVLAVGIANSGFFELTHDYLRFILCKQSTVHRP